MFKGWNDARKYVIILYIFKYENILIKLLTKLISSEAKKDPSHGNGARKKSSSSDDSQRKEENEKGRYSHYFNILTRFPKSLKYRYNYC
jgi:hypothetical protein